MLRIHVAALFLLASAAVAQVKLAPEYRELETASGDKLYYAVVLPEGYDAAATYPVLLALPPGEQTPAMVEAGIERYWGEQARARGWVVVSPVAPEGERFFTGAERLIDPLLDHVRETFRVAGGRMHLAGASNGGRSAFRVAIEHAYQFQSLTVLPGHALDRDLEKAHRLRGVRVRMSVGGDDGKWVERSEATAAALNAAGVAVELEVLDGEGHVPPSLDGDVIMNRLVAVHAMDASLGAGTPGAAGGLHFALDDFNDAAAKGDEDRYFGLFAPEGVFLGTDNTERWTLPEFKDFALRYFERPSAWIYVPQSRRVELSPDEQVGWFDEVLGHARLGTCRGTGVARVIDGQWRIAQYNLTVPIPNDLMGGVAERIRAFEDGAATGVTTVILVRHAEKVDKSDESTLTPAGSKRAQELATALRSAGVEAVFTSQYRRTRDTAAPLCTALGIESQTVPARDIRALVRTIRADHRGETVVVVGHSNTVPAIIAALGVPGEITIDHDEHDNVFAVTLHGESASLLRLRLE